ncbi:MAG: hypothetical protein E7467_08615 [Ruminococcaceae bacterium]|nr:hypothetical protein [Oscillospiraceae bacterium]
MKKLFPLLIIIILLLSGCGEDLYIFDDATQADFSGHMVQLEEEYAPLTDIYPGKNYLKLYDDGTGVIAFSGEEDEITWNKVESGYNLTVQGSSCDATYHDGLLVLELEGAYVTYVAKGVPSPEIPTQPAEAHDLDPTTAYGLYHGLSIYQLDTAVDIEDFYRGECYIRLNTDGMGELCLGGTMSEFAWEVNGQDLVLTDMNGISSYGIVADGILVLDYMETGTQLAFAKEGCAP